jgi:FO synthase
VIDAMTAKKTGVVSAPVARALDKASDGSTLSVDEIETLFCARGDDFSAVCQAADAMRREAVGDTVSYIVTRNINYTNVCTYGCRFCAFSKGKTSEELRGAPYTVSLEEIGRRTCEAWQRGATEVCMQGGIHPDYTGQTYRAVLRAAKQACPDIHVHAFSPLEIAQGARTLGIPVVDYLAMLRDEGLGSLPGTAAEILDDEIRAVLCPDKLSTSEWLSAMEAAHSIGLRSTATIMFGHVERPVHWARHLSRIRALQERTGGITEFVPLPFVATEAPIYIKGAARPGPTFREAMLMHAVARIALHGSIVNIQASWVKLGPQGVQACLNAGVNDLGGTLMNESITRAAGAQHGQEATPATIEDWIKHAGRTPRLRTTLYTDACTERRDAAFAAAPLVPVRTEPFARVTRRTG